MHCSLVMAKSRVTPRKMITIPRLELTSAVLSVQVARFLRRELNLVVHREFFWCDSRVVLGYIANESKWFHVFVANRVQKIKDATKTEQWHHVRTEDNPADQASRGADIRQLVDSSWFRGPEFLWQDPLPCDKPLIHELREDDPEVRTAYVTEIKKLAHATKTEEADPILQRIRKFSDWDRAIKALARLRRYLRYRTGKEPELNSPLTVVEKQEMEEEILRKVQKEEFLETF